jgi:hypothetical protein
MPKHWRKGYTRKDGTKVKGTWVTMKKSKKKSSPWITRKGKLGGKGFLTEKTELSQKRLLTKCVNEYGYRSCLGSIMALERSSKIEKKYGKRLKELREWLKKRHGSN